MTESAENLLGEVLREYFPQCCLCDSVATREGNGSRFCDRHQWGLVSLTDLRQAKVVRQYDKLQQRKVILSDDQWQLAVLGFVEDVNNRVNPKHPQFGSSWVRIRPSSDKEQEALMGVPSLLPFLRVGSLVSVLGCYRIGLESWLVDVRAGSLTGTFTFKAFHQTFIKTVDWGIEGEPPRSSETPSVISGVIC